ncbi:hypothetical protein Q9S36_28220 [Microbacterium sp. ARD31]|uniref:hypothetical protein n=1 Tax=Microbacterium sp. ARD31 TaxID=2962576 RepID=UPI002881ED2D|nr:hypothetical protein [Microbacterium sp. ARD31]MDT0184084.1 hypothetical protein [Microbacterium sp. ARD31]
MLGALLLSLALIAGAMGLKLIAAQRLAVEELETSSLLNELSELSEVSTALTAERDLVEFRSQAMGSDFSWVPLIADLRGRLPGGVELIGVDLTTGGVPTGEVATLEPGLTGTVSMRSQDAIAIAPVVRSLRQMSGVAAVDGRLVTTSEQAADSYTYELTVTFTQDIYSGRFLADGEGE